MKKEFFWSIAPNIIKMALFTYFLALSPLRPQDWAFHLLSALPGRRGRTSFLPQRDELPPSLHYQRLQRHRQWRHCGLAAILEGSAGRF
jgi:hypothetical protein